MILSRHDSVIPPALFRVFCVFRGRDLLPRLRLCTTTHENLRSLRRFLVGCPAHVTHLTHLTYVTLWMRPCRAVYSAVQRFQVADKLRFITSLRSLRSLRFPLPNSLIP